MALVAESRGVGCPVVCLPWFGTERSVMAAAMEPVFDDCAGWRRIYVDLPGCGQSPAGPADSDGVVDAVAEFVDREVGTGPILLAGCSYGGYLAAALARRRPERIAGLLLVCPGIKILAEDRDLPEAQDSPAAADWLAGLPSQLRAHLSSALGNRTRDVAARVAAVLASSDPGDEEYLQRLRTTGYRLSDEDSAVQYGGPTCIVTGRQDHVVGHADQYRALAAYPQASFTVLAEAGHYIPFEQPDAFRRLIRDWLARCFTVLDLPGG